LKVKEALEYGRVSTGNSKMATTTFAIDAFACVTGGRLAKIEGTPCHACYARKLQKLRPSVDAGWKANLAKWQAADPDAWAQAMAFQIKRYNTDGYHRWFDSGDLQSLAMLDAIVNVARMTPDVRHWLPTQERGIVAAWLANNGQFPANLVVRVSASKIDGQRPNAPHASMVYTKAHGAPADAVPCEARTRGNQCGPCRACWSPDVALIAYPKH